MSAALMDGYPTDEALSPWIGQERKRSWPWSTIKPEAKISLGFPPQVSADASAIEMGTKASTAFLRFNNKKGEPLAVFNSEGGSKPSFKTFDAQGRSSEERLNASQ